MPIELTLVPPGRGPQEVLDGKWAIEKQLGQGGMGTVFLARDLERDRKVAIKVLAAELAQGVLGKRIF